MLSGSQVRRVKNGFNFGTLRVNFFLRLFFRWLLLAVGSCTAFGTGEALRSWTLSSDRQRGRFRLLVGQRILFARFAFMRDQKGPASWGRRSAAFFMPVLLTSIFESEHGLLLTSLPALFPRVRQKRNIKNAPEKKTTVLCAGSGLPGIYRQAARGCCSTCVSVFLVVAPSSMRARHFLTRAR